METAARGAAALRMRPLLRRPSGRPEASVERGAEGAAAVAAMERYDEAALNAVPVPDFRQ